MLGLEEQVREALINQATEDTVRYLSENLNYNTSFIEAGKATTADFIKGPLANLLNDADKKEILEGPPLVMAEICRNPEQLRGTIYKVISTEYASYEQLELLQTKFRALLVSVKEKRRIDNEVLADYDRASRNLLQYARTNDIIFRRLTKIAKKHGVNQAIQKETRYPVIRGMFPTPDEYRKFMLRRNEAAINFTLQIQHIFMRESQYILTSKEEIKPSFMFRAMEETIEATTQLIKIAQQNYLEETIQEIYR